MPAGFSLSTLLDTLIGWRGASQNARSNLLQAFCSGVGWRSLISNSIVLLITVGVIILETRNPLDVAWLALVILGGLLPRLYAARLRRMGDFQHSLERKALTIIMINGVYGLLWGAGPFLLLPQIQGPAMGVFLFIMVFGTIMGPYAMLPGILYVRLATTGIATLFAIALYTTPQLLMACLVMSFWLVLRTDIWRGYHRTLRQQFELQETLEARQAELILANASNEESNRKLQVLSVTDPLTGAFNRRHLMSQLMAMQGPAALILFDIDHFKQVNDQFGHFAGDQVLTELVALVERNLRKQDVLARIGGEEFTVVLAGADADTAAALAERLRQAVAGHVINVGGHAIRITVSLGITTLAPGEGPVQATDLLREADAALYQAKRNGRNTCGFAQPGKRSVGPAGEQRIRGSVA